MVVFGCQLDTLELKPKPLGIPLRGYSRLYRSRRENSSEIQNLWGGKTRLKSEPHHLAAANMKDTEEECTYSFACLPSISLENPFLH